MNKDIKKELYSAKNWILKNQKDNGEILWDEKFNPDDKAISKKIKDYIELEIQANSK